MRVWAEVVLQAEPDEAWLRLLAWERQPEWMRDAERVRVMTPHREGPGVRVAVRTRVLGIPLFTEVLEVTEWDPPSRLRLAHRGFVRGFGEWTLHPTRAGTRFRWAEELSIPVPVLGEAALLAYRPAMRRLMRASLAELRGLMRAD
jgi:hypothetical protein